MPYLLQIAVITIGVLILALLVAARVAQIKLNRRFEAKARAVLASARLDQKKLIEEADLANLPACVQKWLRSSGVVGKEKIHSVRLTQSGQMRSAPDKPWMPLEAVQYINVDEPGFVWKATVQAAPLVKLVGMDKYCQGHGSMKFKLLGLLPVVDAQPGPEMDQSAMLRYLAEMVWYPTAALNDYIIWEAVDEQSARATMTWRGVQGAMVLNFDAAGDMQSSVAPRYREEQGRYLLDDWGGYARGYRQFNGMRIAHRSDVVWKYKSGDFNWLKIEVTALEFNQPDSWATSQ